MSLVPHRPVGRAGLVASAQGLGCMGMTAFYGDFDPGVQEAESLATIGKALELGINFLDTAWIYQSLRNGKMFYNEELVGKAIKKFGRDKLVVATKTGNGIADGKPFVSGKPDFIRKQLAESLERLGTDYIDLYYLHRIDPTTPIEETVQCLKEFVEQGKIRYIGLSECTPSELRRAHAVHPVTAIQMEWSLQSRDIENTVVPTARELGVAIVAYSPLGRGFLTDIAALDSLSETDWRKNLPRFSGENFEENKRRAAKFFEIAKRKGCTPAQLALAWVHSKGDDVFPIPGTKSSKRLEENAHAFTYLPLSAEEQAEIEASVSSVGERYPEAFAGRSYDKRM